MAHYGTIINVLPFPFKGQVIRTEMPLISNFSNEIRMTLLTEVILMFDVFPVFAV